MKTLATIAALALALSLASCAEPKEEPPKAPPLKKSATAAIEGFRYVDRDLEKVNMEVEAKKATLIGRRYRHFRLAVGKVLELEDARITFRGEGGDTVLTAPLATADPVKKSVFFEGGAKAAAPGGRTLAADRLAWRYKDSTLRAEGGYVLTTPKGTERGSEVVTDMVLSRLTSP